MPPINEMLVNEILAELIRLQFFKFTPPEEMNQAFINLRKNLVQEGIISTDDEERYRGVSHDDDLIGSILPIDRRIYMSDAEDLAEQGVCDFFNKIKPVLVQEGIQLVALHDEAWWDEKGRYIYYISVNGQRHRIVDVSQGEQNAWCLAHRRTAEIINSLFVSAGSSERAFGMSTGNDAGIIILTYSLYEYIHTLPLKPYALPQRTEDMQCRD